MSISQETASELVRLYDDGHTLREIADKLGKVHGSISYHLRRAGVVPTRGRGSHSPRVPGIDILQEAKAGRTDREIAAMKQVSLIHVQISISKARARGEVIPYAWCRKNAAGVSL